MKIIQLVNGYSKGDGVGNVITALDSMLKKLGYDTKICNRQLNYADIENDIFSEENMLLYHVALSVDPLITYLRCKKILVFHNITEPELLLGKGLMELRLQCSAGLYDIGTLPQYFDAAITFSHFSAQTLIKRGWLEEKIYTVPLPVRFDKLMEEPEQNIISRYQDALFRKRNFRC